MNMLPFAIERIQKITSLRCPSSIIDKRDTSGRVIERIPQPWTLLDARETAGGMDIAFHVPIGYSSLDLEQETDALYASLGSPVTIRDRGGVVVISVSKKDFPDLLPYSPEMLDLSHGRTVLCGYDQWGQPLFHDFRVPHVLIGAQSGYGKTDLLRWWILQLVHRYTPDQLHIDIIDGKGFSFLPFRGIPHIRTIARDLAGAAAILSDAKRTMQTRSDQVWQTGDRDKAAGFRWRLVFIDELAMISPSFQVTKEDKELATYAYADMASIACVGREAQVGMIMATQRPDANVIHPQVKQNCDVSIALRCKTLTNSEIILDHGGAEKLPHGKAGRAIYGGTTDTIFQIPYIGKDDVWTQILETYKKPWRDLANEQRTEANNLDDIC